MGWSGAFGNGWTREGKVQNNICAKSLPTEG
jgi:hypothetical protein